MQQILTSIAFLCATAGAGLARTTTPPVRLNTVYLELGGSLGHYSFNYERTIPVSSNWGLAVSGGVLPQTLPIRGINGWGFNGALKGVYRHGRNRFTAGGGYAHHELRNRYSNGERYTSVDPYMFVQLGYNRIAPNGLTWGIHYTPMLPLTQSGDYVFYWPALQIGYAF